jgi:hypothetical protein
MDVEALLMEDEDDGLEDIDMSQPGMSPDLVDFEDTTPVSSPAKPLANEIHRSGVPGSGVAAHRTRAFPTSVAGDEVPCAARGGVFSTTPTAARPDEELDARAKTRREEGGSKRARDQPEPMHVEHEQEHDEEEDEEDEDDEEDEEAFQRVSRSNPARSAGVPFPAREATDDAKHSEAFFFSDGDREMRDQHTFVPLEPNEIRLAERVCKRVDEPKKHLIRLLIKTFGAALAEGALRETERVIASDRAQRQGEARVSETRGLYFDPADGGGLRRRTPGGVFIWILRGRAPEKEFKAVMRRSAEIDKLLKKQMERGDADDRGQGKRARIAAATAAEPGRKVLPIAAEWRRGRGREERGRVTRGGAFDFRRGDVRGRSRGNRNGGAAAGAGRRDAFPNQILNPPPSREKRFDPRSTSRRESNTAYAEDV